MSKNDHIVLDYSVEPNRHLCKHCGQTKDIEMPIEVKKLLKEMKEFIKLHKNCKKEEK